MAALSASTSFASRTVRSSAVSRRSVVRVAKARSVQVSASADRPLWFPGNPAPAHLDGTLPGDYGFDPLNLGQEPETLKWHAHAEVFHGRTAMLGVAGILFTSIGAEVGLGFPQWYEAGKVSIENSSFSFGTLFFTQVILFSWVEHKRLYDIYSPGSQGDGSFFGITDDFKGKENGYPGGRFFDPMGMSRGSEELYKEYKVKEIKNGRLAMIAFLGFAAQYAATGKGPIQNLAAHLSDPAHNTFATNGVSLPF